MTSTGSVFRGSKFVAATVLALAGCGGGSPAPAASGEGSGSAALTPVKLQLQWVAQAQFAGYYAAVDQGYYKDAGLDVTIKEGGVDIVPQTVLAQGKADYAVAWVPKALASREQGAGITDVGQIFGRDAIETGAADSNDCRAASVRVSTSACRAASF